MSVTGEDLERAAGLLRASGVQPERELVVGFQVSASQPEKCWSEEAFVRLGRLFERLRRTRGAAGERRRRPRNVWKNPVAWREAVTRASAASQSILRYGFVVGGLAAAIILLILYAGAWSPVTTAQARDWLSAIVLIEFVTMLLLATNTAATAITREREANTMELLLATPLTSQYIIFGKLRGLVSFTVPLIVVPSLSVAMFVAYDLLAGSSRPVVYPEAALEVPALMLVYSAFACMLGLQTSLKSKRTVQAVITSVGTLVMTGFGIGMCGLLFTSQAADTIGPLVAPFTMVIAIATVINPELTMNTTNVTMPAAARSPAFGGTLAAVLVYGLIVYRMYRNLVQNFDMTVR
ncbi:MAG: ABC transporter permease subunit, partial [Phycisphaerae bacterium]